VERVLEHVLAAHADAQRAVAAVLAGRAHARAEVRALVVEVDQARRAQQRRQAALQQRRVLPQQRVEQPAVALGEPGARARARGQPPSG